MIQGGIEAFALREIADSLEIKLSNLQYYFKTREALVLAIMEQEAALDIELMKQQQLSAANAADAFRDIVKGLTTRWRGESGVLFSTLGTLAIHNPQYKKLYRSIYAGFYGALEEPLKQLNPGLSKTDLEMRVKIITALIDGAPMQPQVGQKQAFLQQIQAQAEVIARA